MNLSFLFCSDLEKLGDVLLMLALKQPVSDSTLEVSSPYRLLLMYNETLCLNSEIVQLYCTCEVYHRVVFEVSHLSQRIL